MRQKGKLSTVMVILVISLLFAGTFALANGGNFTVDWWSVDSGGGGGSSSSSYTLNGTAGQPDAGTLQGNLFTLSGGFWTVVLSQEAVVEEHFVYLPLVEKP